VDAEVTGRKCIDYIEGFEEFYDFIDACEGHAEYVIWKLSFFAPIQNSPGAHLASCAMGTRSLSWV
jgi:hypothetical protein